jgi:hypothetical protein
MATSLTFLTPVAALLVLGGLVPLVALLLARRRATRVRVIVGLSMPPLRRLLVPVGALVVASTLIGVAAAQPILVQTSARNVRTDAEVFIVLDVSRSMLARETPSSVRRFERAKAAASELRHQLADVPVGLATFSDRTLPHLFPSANLDVFQATLDRSIGIERPPPSSSLLANATKLDALATIRGLRYFTPTKKKRVLIVLTDGESLPVAGARLGTLFRRDPRIATIFVHVWGADERVFTRGVAEPQYLPDPSSRAILDGLATSTQGRVFSEKRVNAIAREARRALGEGPTEVVGQSTGREALAPYLAMAAFLPLGLLLWRRDR